MSIAMNMVNEKPNVATPTKMSPDNKRKKIYNGLVMFVTFLISEIATHLVYNKKPAGSWMIGVNMILTFLAFFYKRTYFAAAQAGTITNAIFCMAMCTFILNHNWPLWVGHFLTPSLSVAMLILFTVVPKYSVFLQVLASLNVFYQTGKHTSSYKFWGSVGIAVVYACIQLFLMYRKRNLGLYISRILNIFQITSLTLDMVLSTKNIATKDNDSLFFANIFFAFAIISIALFRVPKVKNGDLDTEIDQGLDIGVERTVGKKFEGDKFETENEVEAANDVPIVGSFVGEKSAYELNSPAVSSVRGWEDSRPEELPVTNGVFEPNSEPIANEDSDQGLLEKFNAKMTHN